MSKGKLLKLENMDPEEFVPGFHGKMIHTEKMTFAYWNIEKGASIHMHDHHHEQVVNMLEGEFELTVGTETLLLKPGMVVEIPSHVPHGGKAITQCRILDVFCPTREDYRVSE